ncbi:MAG: sulfite exporter TauE/SafE family protein [Chloroflexota bacterium]
MIFLGYGANFWIGAIIAVIFVGIAKAGFGGGVGAIATPIMALLLPVAEAAALLLPLMILADQVAVVKYRNKVDQRSLWVTIPGSILGIGLAWLVFDQLQSSEALLKVGIGTIAILFIVFQLARDFIFNRIDGTLLPDWLGITLGTTAGFTSTIAHVGGPPFQIYVIPQKLPRDIFVGTNAWFFWAVNLLKLIPFWFLGLLTVGNLTITFALVPFVFVGVFFGVWLNGRVRQDVFNWIIYSLMGITGVQLILGESLLELFFRA